MSEASPQSPPLADRALDGCVLAFAAFTLLANATVWLGGGLDALTAAAGVAALAGVGLLAWLRSRGRTEATPAPAVDVAAMVEIDAWSPGRLFALTCALAAAMGAAIGSLGTYWIVALVGVAVAGASGLGAPVRRDRAITSRATDALLLALGLVLALAVAVAHRPDADDAFYANIVVAAVDDPGAPLLAGDTLHGYPDVPMALPVFRVITWELFEAVIARVTGADALTIVHVVVPPLVALLVPLAWARLARLLLPRAWPAATALVVLQLLLVGDGIAGHGDFGVLRLHQGKAVLLHVALPLCSAWAMLFGLAPSRRLFVRLFAVQVAAVGLSASALWLAPVVSGVGLLAGVGMRGGVLAERARTLAWGLAASAHPLLLALALRAETRRAVQEAVTPLAGLSLDGPALMARATELVLGDGGYRAIALFCLVGAAAVSTPAMRRFAVVSSGVFLLLFFTPLSAALVAQHVAGADTYFRVYWLVPLPLLVAAVVVAPLTERLPTALDGRRARTAATLAAAALVIGVAPTVRTLSADNGVRLARPGPKLPPDELATARRIAAHVGADELVLAPIEVARWIPLLHDHPHPLVVREMYLDRLHDLLGREELDRRRALTHTVAGTVRPPDATAMLTRAIDAYPLAAVCVTGPALGWPPLRSALRESPLEVVHRDADTEIWARRRAADPRRDGLLP